MSTNTSRNSIWQAIVLETDSYSYYKERRIPERSWTTLLTTRVGRICEGSIRKTPNLIHQELIQVAAIAVSMIDAAIGVGSSEVIKLIEVHVDQLDGSLDFQFQRDWLVQLINALGKVAEKALSSRYRNGLADEYVFALSHFAALSVVLLERLRQGDLREDIP